MERAHSRSVSRELWVSARNFQHRPGPRRRGAALSPKTRRATSHPGPRPNLLPNPSALHYADPVHARDFTMKPPILTELLAILPLLPLPAAADVILYQHCNFEGYAIRLSRPGDYSLAQLQAMGMQDNDVSSVVIEQPYPESVTLYADDGFRGQSYQPDLSPNDRCFVDAGFNDVLSSVRITGPGGGDGAASK